jgi:hypothetical protein
MTRSLRVFGVVAGMMATLVSAVLSPARAAQAEAKPDLVDLAAVKSYVVDQSTTMKEGSSALREVIETYFGIIEATGFDYATAWEANGEQLTALMDGAKEHWLLASGHYELNEGLVAGVPSLSYYDAWLDAGPSGAEDPEGALDWSLTLPDGRVLEKPGNLFNMTEPAFWGTDDALVGLRVDLDGDGTDELGEVLPEANYTVAAVRRLDDAVAELQTAVDEWEPTIEDTFAALSTMIPTMNEYFEQWKLSTFVTGEASTQPVFVANSRLLDVAGILNGLSLTYDEISGLIVAEDPNLAAQIDAGFADLVGYVDDLKTQEESGTRFTPEQADLFGTEAQDRATRLVGQVSQAIALLGIQI